jgi:hypothetical protein
MLRAHVRVPPVSLCLDCENSANCAIRCCPLKTVIVMEIAQLDFSLAMFWLYYVCCIKLFKFL